MMDTSQYKDYYRILGVDAQASKEEIKKRFRNLAREHHPDVNKDPGSEGRFKDISAAYEILGDEKKREEYDALHQYMKNGGSTRAAGRGGMPGGNVSFDLGGSGFSPDIEEIFNRFFGERHRDPFSGFPGGGFSSRSAQRPKKPAASPPRQTVEISLEEAFHGCKRPFEIRGPHASRRIVVSIPPGVTQGQTIRIGGGHASSTEEPWLIQVQITPHRFYKVEGRDILLELPVTPWEAALGNQVTIPTLQGQVRLKIPPNSPSGARLSLKGKGMPGTPPGNQTVLLKIVTPPALSPADEDAYRRFAGVFSFNPREGML